MKTFPLVLTWLLSCFISLSLQSPTPALPVVCTAPWVIAGEELLNLLPSSQGQRLCSSVLNKYQTVTSITTVYTSTTTSTSTIKALFVAPTPSSTTTTTAIFTSSLTTSTTTTTTATEFALVTNEFTTTTTTTTTTTPLAARSAPPLEDTIHKRSTTDPNVNKLCQVLNVATSVISGFCSCEAPGPTSTSTVVSTVKAILTVPATTTMFTSTSVPATQVSTSTTDTTTSLTIATNVITSITSTTSTTSTSSSTTTTTTTTATAPIPCKSQNIGTCGSGYSNCDSDGTCQCSSDTEGNAICTAPGDCGATCNASSDCAPGFRCEVGDCCGENTCVPVSICPNDNQGLKMLKRLASANGCKKTNRNRGC